MLHLGQWNNLSLTISVKPNCLTISIGSNEVYSYDLSGRLWTALVQEISYRRGLDGKIVAKWHNPAGLRERRWLPAHEAQDLITRSQRFINRLIEDYSHARLSLQPDLSQVGLVYLRRAARFSPQIAAADISRYHEIYQPVGILPPDQYMAVVLQAAEGCSFNTCTFCDFYRGRPFRIKRPDEFRRHSRQVKQFLGDGRSLRRTIFLGDANALVIPVPRLLPLFESIHEEFDVEKMGGIFSFLDGFSGEKKRSQDYRQLAHLGLKRVYIGMESGHEPLLKFLHKPGSPQDVIQAVQAMKTGGVAVGIIILLGAGGQKYAQPHVRDTIQALNQMPLDLDDLVYFSELIESEGLPYTQDAYRENLRPLSHQDRIGQQVQIEAGLVFSSSGGTPHISRYDIREFVY